MVRGDVGQEAWQDSSQPNSLSFPVCARPPGAKAPAGRHGLRVAGATEPGREDTSHGGTLRAGAPEDEETHGGVVVNEGRMGAASMRIESHLLETCQMSFPDTAL